MNKLTLIIIGFLLLVTGFYFVLDSGRMHPPEDIPIEKESIKQLSPVSISSKGSFGFCFGLICSDGGIRLGP